MKSRPSILLILGYGILGLFFVLIYLLRPTIKFNPLVNITTLVESKSKCTQIPETGKCRASIPRYYYNQESKKCDTFVWGGCGGSIPFEALEECNKTCKNTNILSKNYLPWSEAIQKIQGCEIKSVSQSHNLEVDLFARNEATYVTKEPQLGDIFKIVQAVSQKCNIIMATE